jgi:hypothetical protein
MVLKIFRPEKLEVKAFSVSSEPLPLGTVRPWTELATLRNKLLGWGHS